MSSSIPLICDDLRRYRPDLCARRDACGRPFDWRRFCNSVRVGFEISTVFDGQGRYHPRTRKIFLDASQPEALLRVTAAHEIGHWVYQSRRPANVGRLIRGEGDRIQGRAKEEREASKIGTSLLIPPSVILEIVRETPSLTLLDLIREIRFECDVPWELAAQRALAANDLPDTAVVAEVGPAVVNCIGAHASVLSAANRSGVVAALPVASLVARSHTSFGELTTESLSAAQRQSASLPNVIECKRVSRYRSLVLCEIRVELEKYREAAA